MNHLSRLLSIITILKSKRIVTATELAKKYNVSVRTIYRDMKKIEESGVPVFSAEGKGYSIMDGYKVAPLMFDELEVNALITAEQLISKTNDESLIKHFDQTLTKIKSVFRSSLQIQGEFLNSKMRIFKSSDEDVRSSSLSYMQMAITNFRETEILYRVPGKDLTERIIEPLAILSFEEKWLVIAWCQLREDYRSFRLDRIERFRVLDKSFEDRKFDIGKFFMQNDDFARHP